MFKKYTYPKAANPDKVGTYDDHAFSGGGYFYDEVLEYRVWTKEGKNTAYYAFPAYEDALRFAQSQKLNDAPVVLVLQNSYIEEDELGKMKHVHKKRITEWDVEWLEGNKDTLRQIPEFIKRHNRH